jgi:hypothetical protein
VHTRVPQRPGPIACDSAPQTPRPGRLAILIDALARGVLSGLSVKERGEHHGEDSAHRDSVRRH